jgi:uncharacterized protein YjbJ (UPF0337 family)
MVGRVAIVVKGVRLASALLVTSSHGGAGAGLSATARALTGTVIQHVVGRSAASPSHKRIHMNTDVLEGCWKQMRGELKSWWDRLTDADIEQIAESRATLIGLVQERYGYTWNRAQEAVERRLQEYQDRLAGSSIPAATGGPTATMGEKIGALAQTLRDKVPQAGAMRTTATAVADTWEEQHRICNTHRSKTWPAT